ncbi:hypothetical protein IW262DRAFT_1302912 [Armillaria fumosa]|nr:hypothetical protein IW262DRAFT_1302912 [Armillaria fumosa]
MTMMVGILALFLLAISTTAFASSNESDLAVDTPSRFSSVVLLSNAMKLSSRGAAVLRHTTSIVPGSDPDGPLLEDLGEQDGTNMTWTVNLSAGTSVILAIRDSEARTAAA